MYKNLLPIGSVVLLKGGEKRLMICGRIQTRAGSDKVYDYSACLYPEGITGPAGMYFFDREAVETVFFLGFQDKEELDWRANVLDTLGEVEVRDGKIVRKQQGERRAPKAGKARRAALFPPRQS